jgi:hypothetical protein
LSGRRGRHGHRATGARCMSGAAAKARKECDFP